MVEYFRKTKDYGGYFYMDNNIIRRIDTRALGIINANSKEEIVEKGLADDERLLTDAFKIFNKEFYDGKLLEPIIHISHSVKEKVGIKITEAEEWIKHDNGKNELCRGLYISDKILKYGVLSEMGMENAYVMLAVGMITLYDKEMREAYSGGGDVRKENEKAQEDKNEKKKGRRKKKYRGMVTRNGYYYTEEFAAECGRIGIIAKAIRDAEGKPTGRYEMQAGELFIKVLDKYDLLNRRFVCAKYLRINNKNSIVAMDNSSQDKKSESDGIRTYKCPVCKLTVKGKAGIKIKCCNEEHAGNEQLMVEATKKKN